MYAQVPPLRVRPSDIGPLAHRYLTSTTRVPKGSITPVRLAMAPHTLRRMQAVRHAEYVHDLQPDKCQC